MSIEKVIRSSKIQLSAKTLVNIMYTSRMVEDAIADLLKPYKLSSPQFNVLRILRGQQDQPASLSTVQERMVHRNSNTTRLVDKLIDKELVSRRICPHNRRKVEITISQKGLDLLQKVDPLVEQLSKQTTQNLSNNELEQLNTLMDKLREE